MSIKGISINWAPVLQLKFALTNFAIGATTNDGLSKHHQSIALRIFEYSVYSVWVLAELYIRDLHKPCTGPFPHTLYKYSEIRQMFHAGLFMLRKTDGEHRALCRATFPSEFSDTGGVRQFSPAFYRWLLTPEQLLPFLSLIFFNESKVFVRALSRRANYRNRRVPLRCPTNWRPSKLFRGNL